MGSFSYIFGDNVKRALRKRKLPELLHQEVRRISHDRLQEKRAIFSQLIGVLVNR